MCIHRIALQSTQIARDTNFWCVMMYLDYSLFMVESRPATPSYRISHMFACGVCCKQEYMQVKQAFKKSSFEHVKVIHMESRKRLDYVRLPESELPNLRADAGKYSRF